MKQKLLLVAMVGLLVAGVSVGVCGQTFAGSWDFNANFYPQLQTGPFLVLDSTFIMEYTVANWIMTSESLFSINGFESQTFFVDGTLGAFLINGGMAFSSIDLLGLIVIPLSYAHSWMSASVSIASVSFSFSADHYRWPWGFVEWPCSPQTGNYLLFTVVASCDPFSVVTTFDQCGCAAMCFNNTMLSVWGLSFCDATFGASVSFSRAGFEGIHFTLEGIGFPTLSWVSFDLDLFFTTQTDPQKTLTITPVLNLEEACLTVWAEVSQTGSLTITGLNIYGIGVEATWNGVTFYSASSLDPSKNEDVTGYSDYWEVFTITSEGDSCCGGLLDFSVSTYFSSGSAMLFDWGQTSAAFEFGITSNFILKSSIDVGVAGLLGFGLGWTLYF